LVYHRIQPKDPASIYLEPLPNFYAHQNDEVGAVVGGAAGKSFLLYLPTFNPWLNPIEMLWRCFRWEVTHPEMFERIKELIPAIY
jgi:putative transposase